jgi:hypothetical protein
MSFHPRVWMNGLLGVFKPLEKAVLDCLIDRMPAGIRDVLRAQMEEVTLVQRHQSNRVAQFYKIRKGFTREEFSVQIPNSPREQLLGKILFKGYSGAKLTAEIWAANGRLFSIEFSKPPRSDVHHSDIDILECEHFPSRNGPRVAGLPVDYEGLVPLNRFVLRLDEIYDVAIKSAWYWVVAEVPDLGLLGVEQYSSDRAVYLLPYSGEDPTKLGFSLAEALDKASERD